MSDARKFAPSTARNKDPILEALRRVLPARARVLEIASGAGEHAAHFAAALPGLDWQTSDPEGTARDSIMAWIAHAGLSNVRAPLDIDASAPHWGVEEEAPFDALISINMIHIAPWAATLGLFAGAARVLAPHGQLILYGPFKQGDAHNATSNAEFDVSLKARNPEWGVRDIDDLIVLARGHGLILKEEIDMPADNRVLVFGRV